MTLCGVPIGNLNIRNNRGELRQSIVEHGLLAMPTLPCIQAVVVVVLVVSSLVCLFFLIGRIEGPSHQRDVW